MSLLLNLFSISIYTTVFSYLPIIANIKKPLSIKNSKYSYILVCAREHDLESIQEINIGDAFRFRFYEIF